MPIETEKLHCNHVGFLCDQRKIAVVENPSSKTFQVENMALDKPLSMAGRHEFGSVFEREVQVMEFELGTYGICDFSEITAPGIYRVSLPDNPDALTFQFTIADGAWHRLPFLFLDYMHELRKGEHSTYLRGSTHLDDGVRSDDGSPMDTVGGWYDAGDTRQWMSHSTLAAWGLLECADRLNLQRFAFWQGGDEKPLNDFIAEAQWGLGLIPKMQVQDTGMIAEDVGGGGTARAKPGDSWCYENHSGCLADNTENSFTDNRKSSGDERRVRIQYNPISNYTSIAMLAVGARHLPKAEADNFQDVTLKIYDFMESKTQDDYHDWTCVSAWRAIALLECYQNNWIGIEKVVPAIEKIIEEHNPELGWWQNERNGKEPFRGLIHAAQPLIALARFAAVTEDQQLKSRTLAVLENCLHRYIEPMAQTNPYGFMPYGCWREPTSKDELYRKAPNGLLFRFLMPVNHQQKVNHGLAGHWATWAYALALIGQVLDSQKAEELAWSQIHWLTGANDKDVSFISGVGFNNPMPHSRFLGTIVGGFMNGFRGTTEDVPEVDCKREAEWNSTEYWNTPLCYSLLAFGTLLPKKVDDSKKLGVLFTKEN